MKLVNFLRFRSYPRPIYLSLYDVDLVNMIFVLFLMKPIHPVRISYESIDLDQIYQMLVKYLEKKWGAMSIFGIVEYTYNYVKWFQTWYAPNRSAHINRRIFYPTIQFTNQQTIGWGCDCPIVGRFIGCCSHISSTTWFLSYERWQAQKHHMPSGSYMNLATHSIQVSNFYNSSDDGDDDDDVRYSLLWASPNDYFFSPSIHRHIFPCMFNNNKDFCMFEKK
jgi:hypothetical protein